jgi:hypothetical protein
MTLQAATNIDDGEKVIPAGSTVKQSDFDKEVLQHLQDIGAIIEPDAGVEDDRDAKIAELQAQLAALTAGGASATFEGPEQPTADGAGTEVASGDPEKAVGQASGPAKNSPDKAVAPTKSASSK